MYPMAYPVPDARLRELAGDLVGAIERATIALVRLDERLARSDPALAEGVRARAHLREAQAVAGLAGELAPLEDLVLHDAGMDVRAPGTGTVRAARILAWRRRLASRPPEEALQADMVRRLLGIGQNAADPPSAPRAWSMPPPFGQARGEEPSDEALEREDEAPLADENDLGAGFDDARPAVDEAGDLAAIDALIARTSRMLAIEPRADGPPAVRLRDPAYGAEDRLSAWLAVRDQSRHLPGALAATLALDAWLALEPAERGGEMGWGLAAAVLGERGLCEHHLPALALSYRAGRFRWSRHLAPGRRLEGLLAAVAESARLADADLQRLGLARELMLRRCAGRRGTSRLPEMVGLFVELPLVTTGLAARRLKVSPQAVEAMLKELGSSLPRELTGRKRYRAWGIV